MFTCDVIGKCLVQHVLPCIYDIEEQPAQPSMATSRQTDTSTIIAILAVGRVTFCKHVPAMKFQFADDTPPSTVTFLHH